MAKKIVEDDRTSFGQRHLMSRADFKKHNSYIKSAAKAWLSSAIRGTLHTPAFLKEFGLIAYCDYLNDDQP